MVLWPASLQASGAFCVGKTSGRLEAQSSASAIASHSDWAVCNLRRARIYLSRCMRCVATAVSKPFSWWVLSVQVRKAERRGDPAGPVRQVPQAGPVGGVPGARRPVAGSPRGARQRERSRSSLLMCHGAIPVCRAFVERLMLSAIEGCMRLWRQVLIHLSSTTCNSEVTACPEAVSRPCEMGVWQIAPAAAP